MFNILIFVKELTSIPTYQTRRMFTANRHSDGHKERQIDRYDYIGFESKSDQKYIHTETFF